MICNICDPSNHLYLISCLHFCDAAFLFGSVHAYCLVCHACSLQVKLSVFLNYARATSWIMALLVIFFNIASQGLSVGASFWLAAWSTQEDTDPEAARDQTLVCSRFASAHNTDHSCCTLYTYTYTVHIHCTHTLTLHTYTAHIHCTHTLYTAHIHLHCTHTLTLHTYTYTAHIHLHCIHTLTLYTYTYTAHIHLHCTHTLALYTYTYTVYIHLHCTHTLTLYILYNWKLAERIFGHFWAF